MVKITDKEKELITKLGDPYYTVSNIEKWINRNDNVFANAPAALQAMGIKGYYEAMKRMVMYSNDACYALISWNDEYMQQALIATNLTKEQAQIAVKEHTLARLVELDIVETVEMAATMYDAAAGCTPDTEIDAFHVGSDEASISFGSDHEERISIVMQPSITHD